MPKLRRYIALVLLICATLVQIPKSWLHDCHSGEEFNVVHTETTYKAHCSVCDHEALIAEPFEATTFLFKTPFSTKIKTIRLCRDVISAPVYFQNKAPPVLPC